MAQTLKVLLWKIYILRKRRWIITLLEIVIPILMFWLLTRFRTLFPVSNDKISHDADPIKYSSVGQFANEYKIAFVPSNTFTTTIMNNVSSKLTSSGNTVTLVSKSNEDEMVEWLKQQYLEEVGNSTSVFSESTFSKGVGVVFINPGDTSSLQYTLRTTVGGLTTSDDTLYGEQSIYSYASYDISGFVDVQVAIDQAYLTIYRNLQVPNNVFVEYLPIVVNQAMQLMGLLLPYVIVLGFNFVMPSLIRGIVEEKSSGIKEMMKIMGLNPLINWVNWLAFSMFVYVPVTLIISLILTMDSGQGPAIDVNFIVLWILFLLFAFAFVALIFVITTFFTNGTVAIVTALIAWYLVSILLNTTFVSNPDTFGLWIHLLTCLWPTVALQWSLNTINTYQINGHPWTPSNLFDDGSGGGRVSVGLGVVMLIVDFVLYCFLTWYIDNVNPGPYGRAKPFTFIFQNKEYDSKSSIKITQHQNYEAPPQGARVGIKIENLRKTFNGGKVVAVENVDLDIYEGNITALLGHNGAGKTTTMSILSEDLSVMQEELNAPGVTVWAVTCISGMIGPYFFEDTYYELGFFSPTSGKVIVNGKNVFDNISEFRSSLGLCPQHNLLFTYFTVLEHLIFFGMLKGLSKQQSETEGMNLLRTFKIDEKKNELVSKLSGGMKRRLCLCISLMGNPQVLMLDEPTSGLDPETRRQVWDVLLDYRGHRTIIITTHFMEEADILGDRIAIMDHGLVSCYGTSMFLKKLYGTGYHLDISKVERAPVAPITRVVEQHVPGSTIKMSSPTQLSYNIKSEESSRFPALFSALDGWKKDLGLTGMGITCTTMEDVFLKVAEKPETYTDTNGNVTDEVYVSKHMKVTGFSLFFLQIKALASKRSLTWLKTWKSALYMLVITILLEGYTVYRMVSNPSAPDQPNLLLDLGSFPNIHVAVSSTSSSFTTVIQNMVTNKATYNEIPTGTDFESYFDQQIDNNLIQYERQIFAGFKYNSSSFVGGYSRYFLHSYPIALNMLANSLIKISGSSSSITIYSHPIVVKAAQGVCDLVTLAPSKVFFFPTIITFLSMALMVLTKSFIAFPVKERVTSAKQLQLMTGLSPVLYWTVTFLCDFVVYMIIVVFMIACVFIFQTNSVFSASGYMGTLILVFVLFGCSGLPFAYFVSFIVSSSVKGAMVFMLANLITGTIPAVFLAILGRVDPGYGYIRFILSFNPLYAATTAFSYLFSAMYIDGLCLQCGSGCQTVDPLQFLETGANSKAPYGIYNSLIFLAVDIVIYFGLVMLIEYGIVKKLWFLISKMWIKVEDKKMDEDSDVLVEKERVRTSHSLRVTGQSGNAAVLRVKDLGKKYNRKMTAVYGVTFQVNQGECFGLLGVNGAGKSTTFKMLTGEEIPNKGDASIQQISLLKQKSRFLAKIGYCPQFDALNKLLTGKQMLRVYAQLRGIPSSHCESEISRWIEIMGLAEFADRPCGTYSGGNKRKLSTAMAFIGEPPVVFLDEPTSGVDPVSRRKLWDVVAKCQQAGQAIVLTSHSMEECEALCSRLTIMVGGQMKCIGTTQHLKNKFGQGYLIKIKLLSSQDNENNVNRLKSDMANYFRDSSIKDEHLGLLDYHIPDPNTKLAELFSRMEHLKSKHEIIEDYVVSDTTLEQVFMSFARQPLPPKTTDV